MGKLSRVIYVIPLQVTTIISHAICVLTAKSQRFAKILLNIDNLTMDSNYFVDFNR